MVCTHTSDTEIAFRQIEKALKGATEDDLHDLVEEIKSLYDRALHIQALSSEYISGSYLE
jgi:hypothetical protein